MCCPDYVDKYPHACKSQLLFELGELERGSGSDYIQLNEENHPSQWET